MIRDQAIKGIRWTSIASLSGNLLQFLQLVIVARFITAGEYGLMSITLIIVYFAQLLGDMGISNAMIYKREMSRTAFSSLFWFSLCCCWIIFIILFLTAPAFAAFFSLPELKIVLRITAIIFIFLPVQMQYLALLRKQLQFGKIATAEILSKIISLAVAVILARNGYGVFSLVYALLAGLFITTCFYGYWGVRYARPSYVFQFATIRGSLHYGVYQSGNDMLSYFNFNIDTILLGKLTGINSVGLYGFAKNLAAKPVSTINPVLTQVAFPLMAGINENQQKVKRIYLLMLEYLGLLNFLVYPFIAACAENIIRFFFGVKWLPATEVLSLLALYCMIRSVFNSVGSLLSAKGMVKALFCWNLLLLCVSPATVYVAAAAGVERVAMALCCLLLLFVIPMWRYLIYPACGASLREVWKSLRIPLLNAFLLYGLLRLSNYIPVGRIAIKLAINFSVWTIAGFLLTRSLNRVLYTEGIGMLKDVLKLKKE